MTLMTNGVLNLVNMLPEHARPDIGPKLYVAAEGTNTLLHGDQGDAVNWNLFCSRCVLWVGYDARPVLLRGPTGSNCKDSRNRQLLDSDKWKCVDGSSVSSPHPHVCNDAVWAIADLLRAICCRSAKGAKWMACQVQDKPKFFEYLADRCVNDPSIKPEQLQAWGQALYFEQRADVLEEKHFGELRRLGVRPYIFWQREVRVAASNLHCTAIRSIAGWCRGSGVELSCHCWHSLVNQHFMIHNTACTHTDGQHSRTMPMHAPALAGRRRGDACRHASSGGK